MPPSRPGGFLRLIDDCVLLDIDYYCVEAGCGGGISYLARSRMISPSVLEVYCMT